MIFGVDHIYQIPNRKHQSSKNLECTCLNGALASLRVIFLEPFKPIDACNDKNYAGQHQEHAVEGKSMKKAIDCEKKDQDKRNDRTDTGKNSQDFHAHLDRKNHAAGYVGGDDVVDTADNSCLSLLLILLLNVARRVHRMLVDRCGCFVINRLSIKRRIILLAQLILLLN